jgi:hypothetical protein
MTSRATAAEVLKLCGGTFTPPWDNTSVGNLCTQIDAEIDGRASPNTFGTGTNHQFFANYLVYRHMIHSNWAAGGAQPPEPYIWTRDVEDWFQRLLTNTTTKGTTYVKMD